MYWSEFIVSICLKILPRNSEARGFLLTKIDSFLLAFWQFPMRNNSSNWDARKVCDFFRFLQYPRQNLPFRNWYELFRVGKVFLKLWFIGLPFFIVLYTTQSLVNGHNCSSGTFFFVEDRLCRLWAVERSPECCPACACAVRVAARIYLQKFNHTYP